MFQITYTQSALQDISTFRKQERTTIFDKIDEQLLHQPGVETRNRKRLRPNQTAEWELRVENYRILYEIDKVEQKVEIKLVGYKIGSLLLVRGKEYRL
jgi:mRNA-degrading endonuclease RelE of RelBE toxin-antitoxin system